jgi:hypothetical protein
MSSFTSNNKEIILMGNVELAHAVSNLDPSEWYQRVQHCLFMVWEWRPDEWTRITVFGWEL